jgi:malonate transporter and related proteins
MLPVFESLLPIFLLILIGFGIKLTRFLTDDAWLGLQRLSYYIFFPALLLQTLYVAEFGKFAASGIALGFACGIGFVCVATLILKRPLQTAFAMDGPAYSSFFQAVTRWNAFVVLAVAERLYGQHGLAVVAIGVATMVVPLNVINVLVVTSLSERQDTGVSQLRQVLSNPLIVAVLIGIPLNLGDVRLYAPIETLLELLASVSLPTGIILVGAGLMLRMPAHAYAAVALGSAVKLAILPVILACSAWLFGVRGDELVLVALCGAGPSAMNGYLVARELGGDAPLFAAIVSLQTAFSFLSMPLVIVLAAYPAG